MVASLQLVEADASPLSPQSNGTNCLNGVDDEQLYGAILIRWVLDCQHVTTTYSIVCAGTIDFAACAAAPIRSSKWWVLGW